MRLPKSAGQIGSVGTIFSLQSRENEMPRKDYTNYPPTDWRMLLFERLARSMGLDASQHLHRVKIIDSALMQAASALPPEPEKSAK